MLNVKPRRITQTMCMVKALIHEEPGYALRGALMVITPQVASLGRATVPKIHEEPGFGHSGLDFMVKPFYVALTLIQHCSNHVC